MDSIKLGLENLPTEIIVKMLDYLPFKDLLSVTEVSRTFYTLATDPLIWKSYNVSHHEDPEKLISTLNLDRFQKLETLHISQGRIACQDVRISEQQIHLIFESLENIELKHLTIQHLDLTSISSTLLSRVFNNIETVSFNHAVKIDDDQLSKILEDIPEGKMKAFQVEELDFSYMKIKSLRRAVNSLESFNTYYCEFSPGQLEAVFEQMAEQTKLKDLSFFNKSGLEEISSMTIAKAFNNLERLYVGQSRLSAEQMFSIFEEMAHKSKLSKINLVFKDSYPFLLAAIPSDILSKSLNSLNEVVMPYFHLSKTQLKDILEGVAAASSNIKHLDLGENKIPDVSLEVLKKVMFKLEPNEFKFNLQGKILEIYEETILSLRQELLEKEVKQVALRVQQVKLKAESKAVRTKIVNVLTKNQKLKSFLLSSNLSKANNVLRKLSSKVQVKIFRKSKFSSSFRFATKSRVVKKSNVFMKMKFLSNNHVCQLK